MIFFVKSKIEIWVQKFFFVKIKYFLTLFEGEIQNAELVEFVHRQLEGVLEVEVHYWHTFDHFLAEDLLVGLDILRDQASCWVHHWDVVGEAYVEVACSNH